MRTYNINKEQQKIRIQSAVITTIITLLIFILAWLWIVERDTIPPKDENPYEVVGRIDFGNFTSGSDNKNTFEEVGVQQETQPTHQTSPQTEEVITTPEPAPTSQNASEETSTQQTQPQEEIDPEALFELGESNEGENETGLGNEGTPDSPVLDPKGLYQFGNGKNGLQGRIPLSLPQPEYTVDKETRITYEFVISPAGNVISVKPITYSTATELINAGKRAIYKWKFNRINSNKNQTARVTITFKLK